MSVDLDNAQKHLSEIRRRHDELAATHAGETARHADDGGAARQCREEAARVQKLCDEMGARLIEANESLRGLDIEMNERETRHQAERQALASEVQALGARLQAGATEQAEAANELNTLRTRLADLETERKIAEKRQAALTAEIEQERRRKARRRAGGRLAGMRGSVKSPSSRRRSRS